MRIVVGNFKSPTFGAERARDALEKGGSDLDWQLGRTGVGEFIEQLGSLLATDGRFGVTRSRKPQPLAAQGDVDVLGKTMDDLPPLGERGAPLKMTCARAGSTVNTRVGSNFMEDAG